MLEQKSEILTEEQLLKKYEKLIYKLSNKKFMLYSKKYPLEDILQEAKISAVRAYRIYDISKNTKLITHLHNYINFYLSHFFRADTGIIRIPVRVMSDKEKVKPEIVDCDFMRDNASESIYEPAVDLTHIDNKIFIESCFVVLNDKEKDIVSLLYLRGFSFDEVANMYNVSRQAINVTATKSMKKMREHAAKMEKFQC
jgi:RNA polymerase sigma factor (sigma-70 family)